MKFLYGNALQASIRSMLKAGQVSCAVAFWGKGADGWIDTASHPKTRVICNLTMGGTNPSVIRSLPRDQIRQHDTLHAKVFVSPIKAIVGSANVSSNGLGLEGVEQSGWLEAGMLIQDKESLKTIQQWFDALWESDASRLISDDDLVKAERKWRQRRSQKPSLPSFASFDPADADLPLIDWIGDLDYEVNAEQLSKKYGYEKNSIHERVDAGADVEGASDRRYLKPNKWIICWYPDKNGLPAKRRRVFWRRIDQIVEGGYKKEGDRQYGPVALGQLNPGTLFEIDDRFEQLFRTVMSRAEYKNLREQNFDGAWFTPARVKLMARFWKDLRAAYLRQT